MIGFVMVLHAIISILLVVIILMQSGRGGGLTEGFASAESMFGAQTNEFMIKATTIFASLFLITCLGLAVLSSRSGKSLMSNQVASETEQIPVAEQAVEGVVGEETGAVEQIPVVDQAAESIIGEATEVVEEVEVKIDTPIVSEPAGEPLSESE